MTRGKFNVTRRVPIFESTKTQEGPLRNDRKKNETKLKGRES